MLSSTTKAWSWTSRRKTRTGSQIGKLSSRHSVAMASRCRHCSRWSWSSWRRIAWRRCERRARGLLHHLVLERVEVVAELLDHGEVAVHDRVDQRVGEEVGAACGGCASAASGCARAPGRTRRPASPRTRPPSAGRARARPARSRSRRRASSIAMWQTKSSRSPYSSTLGRCGTFTMSASASGWMSSWRPISRSTSSVAEPLDVDPERERGVG